MILKSFKRTDPGTIFMIIMVFMIMWSGTFMVANSRMNLYFDIDPMPLYGILSTLTGTHPLPGIILAMVLTGLMSFLVVSLNTSLFFINERTFLPALFYIMLTGLFPQYQVLNPAIFGAVFLMIAIKRIMDSYRVQGIAYSLYDAGLLIGTGSLFYSNLIWFGIITIIGILLLRTINIREIILSILGIATPFVLGAGLYYAIGRSSVDFFTLINYNLFGKDTAFAFIPPGIAALTFTSLLVLAALLQLFAMLGSKKIQSRKIFSLLIWVLVISVIVFLSVPSVSVEMIYIAAIPACYLLTHYFIFMRRKTIPEVLFILFFLLILSIQFWYAFKN
ncbi:MAG TPA: DUF6427 family protein [Bacteroidales bacterium]|jgi:hypothetical protein|nr:DUF6427 family protein [Bacteroidales bacterium]